MKYEIYGYDSDGRIIATLQASGALKAAKKAAKALDLEDVQRVHVVQKPDETDPNASEKHLYSFFRAESGVEYEGPGADLIGDPKIKRRVVQSFEITLNGVKYEASRGDLQEIVNQAKEHGIT